MAREDGLYAGVEAIGRQQQAKCSTCGEPGTTECSPCGEPGDLTHKPALLRPMREGGPLLCERCARQVERPTQVQFVRCAGQVTDTADDGQCLLPAGHEGPHRRQ